MSAQSMAYVLDQIINFAGGIVMTLIGFRKIGPSLGKNEKYDSIFIRFRLRYLKWLGSLSILCVIVSVGIRMTEKNHVSVMEGYKGSKEQLLQSVNANITSNGKLAVAEAIVELPDGFVVAIPKGFTYSKPAGAPYSLVAIYDVNGASTPTMLVVTQVIQDSFERDFEKIKGELSLLDKNAKYSATTITETEPHKLYRFSMTSERNGVDVKGGALAFGNGGKLFLLSYGTTLDRFALHASSFERIASTFAPKNL